MPEEMNKLFEKLCDELCEAGKQELTQDSLKTIDTMAHAAKNVLKVMEGCEGGGSYAYYDEEPRTTAIGGMSNRGYSRGGNNVVDGLKELMHAAPQEMQGEIQRLIKKLDNM